MTSLPSRRLAAVAALAALAVLLSACPSASPRPTPSADTPSPPARGGSITIAYPNEPPTLNPFAAGGDSTATLDVLQLVMPSLFASTDAEGVPRLTPEIAAAEPFFDDTGATIRIAPGARWSDGRPIGIDDLRATWRLARRAGAATSRRYRDVTAITAEPGGAIRVTVRDARAAELGWLFSEGLGVLPARSLVDANARRRLSRSFPISGGPFVLKRWRRGLDMTFERNPHAFGTLVPALDRIRIVFVPDALGALTLFKQGKVDALGPYASPDWARRVSEVSGAQIATDTGTTTQRLVVAKAGSTLASTAVRRALIEAFDRSRTVAALIGAEGALAPCASCATYSPRRARADLERAGWRGRPIRHRRGAPLAAVLVIEGTDELAGFVARALQRQVALVGFDVQVIALGTDTLWRQWLSGARLDAAILTTRAEHPTESHHVFDLGTLRVTMAARPGVTISSEAGPDGPFAGAPAWHR